MKLSPILNINAIVFVALGIAFALYGPIMMAFLDVPELDIDGIAYWHITAFARMFGAALFGFGFLIWAMARTADILPGQTVRAVVRALTLGNLMLTAAAITQQSQRWLVPAGWLLTAVFAIFTLAYLFLILRDPTAARSRQPQR
jgi:hypothetical protein